MRSEMGSLRGTPLYFSKSGEVVYYLLIADIPISGVNKAFHFNRLYGGQRALETKRAPTVGALARTFDWGAAYHGRRGLSSGDSGRREKAGRQSTLGCRNWPWDGSLE